MLWGAVGWIGRLWGRLVGFKSKYIIALLFDSAKILLNELFCTVPDLHRRRGCSGCWLVCWLVGWLVEGWQGIPPFDGFGLERYRVLVCRNFFLVLGCPCCIGLWRVYIVVFVLIRR